MKYGVLISNTIAYSEQRFLLSIAMVKEMVKERVFYQSRNLQVVALVKEGVFHQSRNLQVVYTLIRVTSFQLVMRIVTSQRCLLLKEENGRNRFLFCYNSILLLRLLHLRVPHPSLLFYTVIHQEAETFIPREVQWYQGHSYFFFSHQMIQSLSNQKEIVCERVAWNKGPLKQQ